MLDVICRDVYRGEQLSLQVLDRSLARVTTHEEPYAVISITEPQLKHPQLAVSSCCKAVLRLNFSDIRTALPALRGTTAHVAAFTPQMAEQIVAFVQKQRRDVVRLLIVHCEAGMSRSAGVAGMSRSAGVATALSQFYNHDETHFLVHYRPNAYVRRLILDALRDAPEADV